MDAIPDINVYNAGMRKSMLDKLWFLDKIPDSVIRLYDYGCADGSLLKMAGEISPHMFLYGYDVNPEMIELAVKNVPNAGLSATPMAHVYEGTVLNASSVFHEIHAYSENVEEDYNHIFGVGADYIAIRDMFYSSSIHHDSDFTDMAKVYQHEPLEKILKFERYHGPISQTKNLLHYLLKYRYKENWDREVKENYFPHSLEEFISRIPNYYEIVYVEHYTLPFIKDRVMEDFGIDLKEKTHAKILLKLRIS